MCSAASIGEPGRDATDHGNSGLLLQSYPARCAGNHLDHAFAGERPQVLFGRVRRLEPHRFADFAAGRREARTFGIALDQLEYLGLAGGQRVHGASLAVIIYRLCEGVKMKSAGEEVKSEG